MSVTAELKTERNPVVPLMEPVGLGPVPLAALATYMRDGTWLDLRCDNEVVERVRIIEIIVRVQGEDIVVRQEWLNEETDDDDDYYHKHTFSIDSDAIWKVVPSTRHPRDVRPYGIDWQRPAQDEELQQQIAVAVLNHARALWLVTLEELRATRDWKLIGPRYASMIVLYEMSDLEPLAITELLGYASVQPLVSARQTLVEHPHDDVCRARAKMAMDLGKHVDSAFAPHCPRTSRAFPRDYKPLLKR